MDKGRIKGETGAILVMLGGFVPVIWTMCVDGWKEGRRNPKRFSGLRPTGNLVRQNRLMYMFELAKAKLLKRGREKKPKKGGELRCRGTVPYS